MNFNQFQLHLSAIKIAPLDGYKAHFIMAPKMRIQYTQEIIESHNPKQASVLALFYPDQYNETRFLLTQRASYNGTHSAQISFPGGKREVHDTDERHTAIRETYEEVGVEMKKIKFLKEFTKTYIPPSNFLISPFMGYLENTPIFEPNEEVDTIIEVKLSDLLNDNNVTIKNMSTSYMDNIDVPCFKLNNYVVWGATAMILSEIKCVLKTL